MPKPFVLIVEDERDIAALFQHLMEMAGYRTEIAANGTLALERLTNSQPDLVLLDLRLPDISGARVLQGIRSNERLKSIPVVVITAFPELTEELGVAPDLVLLKPVSSEQLIALVERLRRRNKRMQTAPFQKIPWDKITGLYNRAFFLHRLDSAIRSMQDNGQSLFAVLSISPGSDEDVRRDYGESSADDFLRAVATSLKASVRPTDTLARLEGHRFCILIEQAPGLRIPDMIAARIQSRLKDGPLDPTGGGLACNIGVLLCDNRYDDPDDILRDAEAACALAMAAGPGASLTFDHDTIRSNRAVGT